MNLPDRNAWSSAASPSNLAMAALVGFLFVGQATDWKILGRKARPDSSVKFGASAVTGMSAGTRAQHSRQVPSEAEPKATPHDAALLDSNSEVVADRRPGSP